MTAPSRPVVVVPVFNAPDAVHACFASLRRTLGAHDRVMVADDASTDPAIAQACEALVRDCAAEVRVVRRPHNLGFVGNVNRAFAETGDDDVVLLNSDTVTTTGWLDRLIAAADRDPRIATLTPWSNNAEICSFPGFCVAAPAPVVDEAERIAAAAATLSDLEPPELPTAVGFAMYVRRSALQSVGDFDAATFGRGYGEENDFCLRAAAHGWRNALCPTAYIVHVGNASFSAIGLGPGGENLRRLLARYPGYNAKVADFIAADPLRPLRERLSARLATP